MYIYIYLLPVINDLEGWVAGRVGMLKKKAIYV